MLKEYCRVSDSYEKGFIGVRFVDGKPEIVFPIGYRKADDDKEIRRDTLNLLGVLNRFSDRSEGQKTSGGGNEESLLLPLSAYQYVIFDFLSNGYYSEKDVDYKIDKRGKTNWKRTIQKVKPIVSGDNPIYLDFVVKKSVIKSDIITRIHEYCVFESFSKIGWLYLEKDFMPKKPRIKYNKKAFLSALNDALKHTFNTEKKRLFTCMIDIINTSNEKGEFPEMYYGLNDFTYIWERLIDYVYGVENKQDYFPHGYYRIVKGDNSIINSSLKPDTIIDKDGKIYILDAKYYKYGVTYEPRHLPETASIHKQITYGEFIATNFVDDSNKVYNAFVLPYESKDGEPLEFVAVGMGDWIPYDKSTSNYKYVVVICLDIKQIINTYSRNNLRSIEEMTEYIEESLGQYRSTINS